MTRRHCSPAIVLLIVFLCTSLTAAQDPAIYADNRATSSTGSGIQCRSRTGIPWLAPISPAVTADVGPVNLN
jgi:hypothetical protein